MDPRILVDASTRDDAAVFRLAPDRALVATVDFFTPIVDSPYDFGRIAAANALSDVYAMGASPLFTLSLVGWPRGTLPLELLGDVLRGGADVVREAGAFILGGHSVDDPEPKFGMVAIGEVHPDRIVTNAAARGRADLGRPADRRAGRSARRARSRSGARAHTRGGRDRPRGARAGGTDQRGLTVA